MFGLQQGAQVMRFVPCLPTQWQQAEITLRRDGLVLRFIAVRALSDAALKKTEQWDAQLLLPGQTLAWQELQGDHCFVIPLLEPLAAEQAVQQRVA